MTTFSTALTKDIKNIHNAVSEFEVINKELEIFLSCISKGRIQMRNRKVEDTLYNLKHVNEQIEDV